MNLKFTIAKQIAHIASLILPVKIMKDKRFFHIWEKKGYHVTPVHFYEPIPDSRTLSNDIWLKQSQLVGIDVNEQRQINLLGEFSSKFKDEYDRFPSHKTPVPYQYYIKNGQFESVDGEILYCMIRYFQPRRILEIGSGYSTYLSAQAILKNKEENNDYDCELVAIEPHPNEILKAGFAGLSRLLPVKVQDVTLAEFEKLKENDILFIDSSHVLKIGSDVQYEYLEILPRLNKGVIVHVHDILLPAEYSKEWVLKYHRFWTEQYLLQAFLIFNDHFEVLWAGNYMHLKHPDKLQTAFGSYKPDEEKGRKSFWLRKIK